MNKALSRNIKLGIFVTAGTLFLIFTLYMIGSKRNLFSNTFRLNATFQTVNGLTIGNNVRYAGIDVGTVEDIEILNDSTINVVMRIEEKVRKFIHQNAVAMVGTDGLMGNKLVNISSGADSSSPVNDGDTLRTRKPVEGEEMMRTLAATNENLKQISEEVKRITGTINNTHGTIWLLLHDTLLAANLKLTVENIKMVSAETKNISADLSDLIDQIKNGKGIAGTLLTDSLAAHRFMETLESIHSAGYRTDSLTRELNLILAKLNTGRGGASALLNDSLLANDLKQSMHNIKKGTEAFTEDMEALRYSWPFKKYFKKKEKEKRKEPALPAK